jgi:catechol 2,3-dioxygenase-like lactoylglutathione lyase family enzyme
MVVEFRHIALFVPDLREAEAYYRHLLAMELIGREALLEDDLWYTLPPEKGWADADAAGIELSMVALQRGSLVLALFPGKPRTGQLHMIGVNMPARDIASIRKRLPPDTEVWEHGSTALTFRDRYAIVWQIYKSGISFRSSGESYGRWLDV